MSFLLGDKQGLQHFQTGDPSRPEEEWLSTGREGGYLYTGREGGYLVNKPAAALSSKEENEGRDSSLNKDSFSRVCQNSRTFHELRYTFGQ